MADIDRIISFFLNLFKLQTRKISRISGPADYRPVPDAPGNDTVYELRVQADSEWKTRRMSIRRLGEAVESKSICYKVIYDDQMVVKIPPRPITDFSQYLAHIHSERHIARQMSPDIPCVWPSLSAILEKVPGLLDASPETGEALEDRCIKLVSRNPSLQRFLTIGPGFVFFMNLARNEFFNQIVEKLHDINIYIKKEYDNSLRLFDNMEAFEAVYGEAADAVFFNINKLCRQFQKKIDALTLEAETPTVGVYKTREWFFSFLTGETPDMDPDLFTEKIASDAAPIFSSIVDQNRQAIDQYRKTVEKSVRKQIFTSNRKTIEGLIINILNLLYRLQSSHVAVRDLKSDNIFIACHSNRRVYHLWDPESYDLGLIDLETAIDTSPSVPDGIKQPSLAGTPSYMTPSHLFKNPLLQAAFGAPPDRVMLLQDWFAAVGMIYNTATGRLLFVKTAQLIPQIMQMKKAVLMEKKPLVNLFRHVSCIFWESAEQEFMKKLGQARNRFKTIQINPPIHIAMMLKKILQEENAAVQKSIRMVINTAAHLKPDAQYLMEVSEAGMAAYRKNREIKAAKTGKTSEEAKKMLSELRTLEMLKRQLERHDLEAGLLTRSITGYDLMIFLINRIMHVMRPPSWIGRD
jgi:serine/threonine protein kinase